MPNAFNKVMDYELSVMIAFKITSEFITHNSKLTYVNRQWPTIKFRSGVFAWKAGGRKHQRPQIPFQKQ
jgi:hypothetical protein